MARTVTPILSSNTTISVASAGVVNVQSMSITDTREEIDVTNLSSALKETKGGLRQISIDLVCIATSGTDAGVAALKSNYASGAEVAFALACDDDDLDLAGNCVITQFSASVPNPVSGVITINARIAINELS